MSSANQSQIDRLNREISDLRKADAREAKKEADLIGKINKAETAASRTKNDSTHRTKMKEIERASKDLASVQKKRADISGKIAAKAALDHGAPEQERVDAGIAPAGRGVLRHGQRRLRRSRAPWLDPGHAAGLQLGVDLVGDFGIEIGPVALGLGVAAVSGYRGSPRRASRASPSASNPSRQTGPHSHSNPRRLRKKQNWNGAERAPRISASRTDGREASPDQGCRRRLAGRSDARTATSQGDIVNKPRSNQCAQALESQRRSGYRNTAAAAREIVDNAMEAGATRIDVCCGKPKKLKAHQRTDPINAIAFIDNGSDMVPAMARYALSWGAGDASEGPSPAASRRLRQRSRLM